MTVSQKSAYRAAFDYHEKHIGTAYEAGVLEQAAKDAGALVGGDPFRAELLRAVYMEIVREAKGNNKMMGVKV